MANSENQVELKLNLDVSGVQEALYNIVDQFTGTGKDFDKITKKIEGNFKSLEAAIKRYGANSNEAIKAAANYQRSLTDLVANGVDPASSSFKKLSNAISSTGNSMSQSGENLKKTNKTWTSLSLIVQDLPFGFRGIQNNLPALVGSFAAASGGIYFAFSAIIAVVTIFEKEISNLFNTVSNYERIQKVSNSSIEAGGKSYAEAKKQVMLLNEQVIAAAGHKNLEKKAVDDYNDTIGVTLGKLKTFKEVQDSLINQGDKYINYIFLMNIANAAAGKVAEESANMMMASMKKPADFIGNWDKFWSVQFNIFGDFASAATQTAKNLQEAGTKNQRTAISEAGKNAVAAEEVWKKFKKLAEEARAGLKFGSFGDDKPKHIKLEDNSIALLKSQQEYYKDNILMYASFEQEIIRRQRDLDIKQATIDGKSAEFKLNIYDKANQDIINSAKNAADKLLKIQQDLGEKDAKELQARLDWLAKMRKKSYDDQLSASDQFYNNQLDLASGDKKAQVEILSGYNDDLKTNLYNGTILYEDYYKRISDNAKKISELQAAIMKEAFDGLMKIGNGLMNMLGPSFDMLIEKGASLGEVLANAFQSVIKQLAKVIVLALIAVALIALIFPGKLKDAGGAMKLFGGLISQGMGLGGLVGGGTSKPKEFASGGIISGPTYGLMGEYPGAKSNPEVVAPLDKLKDLIGGGGGGQFVLKGQDLVLAMTRSEKSLNLRRG